MGTDSSLVLRRAQQADLGSLAELLAEASAWLAGRGSDQWQGPAGRRHVQLHVDVTQGAVWLVEDDGLLIATITVDEWADTDFWRHSDHVHDALYAHRMAVTRCRAGRGLGSALLDWAAALAEHHGRSWLRLDAWSTNHGLHLYYERLGFEMLRNDPVPGRGSGALFQRPATVRSGGPLLLPVAQPVWAAARASGARDGALAGHPQ